MRKRTEKQYGRLYWHWGIAFMQRGYYFCECDFLNTQHKNSHTSNIKILAKALI